MTKKTKQKQKQKQKTKKKQKQTNKKLKTKKQKQNKTKQNKNEKCPLICINEAIEKQISTVFFKSRTIISDIKKPLSNMTLWDILSNSSKPFRIKKNHNIRFIDNKLVWESLFDNWYYPSLSLVSSMFCRNITLTFQDKKR